MSRASGPEPPPHRQSGSSPSRDLDRRDGAVGLVPAKTDATPGCTGGSAASLSPGDPHFAPPPRATARSGTAPPNTSAYIINISKQGDYYIKKSACYQSTPAFRRGKFVKNIDNISRRFLTKRNLKPRISTCPTSKPPSPSERCVPLPPSPLAEMPPGHRRFGTRITATTRGAPISSAARPRPETCGFSKQLRLRTARSFTPTDKTVTHGSTLKIGAQPSLARDIIGRRCACLMPRPG